MREIPLTQGKVALVDDDDYDELHQYRWCASEVSPGKIYAIRKPNINGKYPTVYMHRMILAAGKGEYVDHEDGDTLNNQKNNIRICTHAQNISNRSSRPTNNKSGYIGVHWNKACKKWSAQVGHKRLRHHIGYFDDPVEAARARDQKARELHGEYAYLNFEDG